MKSLLLILIFPFLFLPGNKGKIVFKTHSGDSVVVLKDVIYYNNAAISKAIEGIIYESKYNRLIEQGSNILLFLEIDGSPNFNTLQAFKINKTSALKLAECVYNDGSQGIGAPPFTDIDHDGKLEFGGFGLTEYYSKDSAYYNPSQYYEISNGKLRFDSSLAKSMDIKVNGMYLAAPLNKEGNCCVVIKKINKKGRR